MLKLYALDIEEFIEENVYQTFFGFVSEEKKDRILRYHFEADQKRSLYADLLIRYFICRKYGILNHEIRFHAKEHGKPYLDNYPDFFYNISHSGKWVFLGISSDEIGVDIEQIGKCNLDIAKRFFTPEEYLDLINTDMESQDQLFYAIWCMKESYVKFKGIGLTLPLNSFRCKITKSPPIIELVTEQEENIFARTFLLDNEYSAATCSLEEPADNISHVTLKDIANFFLL